MAAPTGNVHVAAHPRGRVRWPHDLPPEDTTPHVFFSGERRAQGAWAFNGRAPGRGLRGRIDYGSVSALSAPNPYLVN